MRKLDIKIGYQCNNFCLHCVQGNKRKKFPKTPVKDILQELAIARHECDAVVFTGGEPTIHPNFLSLVKFAKSLGYGEIQIQTNGRMFSNADFTEKCIRAGANHFSPSVHGHNSHLHDFLTHSPGSFVQVCQGIKNIRKYTKNIISNTVISRFNYRYLPEIVKLLVGLGVNQIQLAYVHITGTALENKDTVPERKSIIMPYVKKAIRIGEASGKRMCTEAIPYCFMVGYEKYIAEAFIPLTKMVEQSFTIDKYEEYRITKGKSKGPHCKDCIYFIKCEGPWKEYPLIFGWDEFIPVRKKKK